MPKHLNDITLLEKLKAGDQQAFDHLYVTYRHWLFISAMTILRNEASAEELVQEFFIDFWQRRLYHNIDARTSSSLRNFLFVSIKNRCLNQLSKDKTRKNRLDQFFLSEDFMPPENRLENEELGNRLEHAIAQLPPRQCEVFKMAYLFQKTRKEIAIEMNISEETVKKQLSLALKTLRLYLKELENL